MPAAAVVILAAVVTALSWGVSRAAVAPVAPVAKDGAEIVRAADIIRIDAVARFRALEKAEPVFRHDLHTGTLASLGKDCSACHMTGKDGVLSTEFMRVEDKDAESLKLLYHTNCISCHTALKKNAASGGKAGPVEGECKRCHDESGRYVPERRPFGYRAALHDGHVRSPFVKAGGDDERNCALCHHNAAPGKEDSCRVCHQQGYGIRPWYGEVGHEFCLSCHLKVRGQAPAAALECAGCHSAEAAAVQAENRGVPRLMRGQPDTTLIFPVSGKKADAAPSAPSAMKPSLFDHEAHEGAVPGCRTCHHVRIGSCTSCHTTDGREAGNNVNLERAMHASCASCHSRRLKEPECAGCHGFVKPSRGGESCAVCHTGAPGLDEKTLAAGAAASLAPADKAALADAAKAAGKEGKGAPDFGGAPEVVILDALKSEFEGNEFNHKSHVEQHLAGAAPGSDALAAAFHTDKATLCAGCHHNSPPSMTPPRCASCHSKTVDVKFPERPALKAAYHLLCMGCHDRMEVEPAAKTDCTACHAQAGK
jgi:hypothetical protein